MLPIILVLAVLAALALYVVGIYNGLVRKRNLVQEAFSGIDVQLKKRTDLIPNLVNTVKGYMEHERDVLEQVTRYRAEAQRVGEQGDMVQRAKTEGLLGQALGRLFAVAENYPDLKANQNFLDLQSQLAQVENDIQLARRYYNGTVRNLNIAVESFPSNLVANAFGFHKEEYFELEAEADREVPQVSF